MDPTTLAKLLLTPLIYFDLNVDSKRFVIADKRNFSQQVNQRKNMAAETSRAISRLVHEKGGF